MSLTVLMLIGSILGVAVTVAIAFWHEILGWAEQMVFPWFEQHLPGLAPYVRHAFAVLDGVVVGLREAARRAWEALRPHLLKSVVEFQRLSEHRWLRVVTSWLIEQLTPTPRPTVTEVREEREIDWDELPEEVRQSFLRRDEQSTVLDVRRYRDLELAQLVEQG